MYVWITRDGWGSNLRELMSNKLIFTLLLFVLATVTWLERL
jgi:hypothetical protein